VKRTLVLYATPEGQIKKIVERVGDNLGASGFDVDFRNVRSEAPGNLDGYSAVALVASIQGGSHEREMLDFVAEHQTDLERMPSLFISVSSAQTNVDPGARTEEDLERERALVRDMLARLLKETGWQPTELESVAGASPYARFNPIVCFILSREPSEAEWARIDRVSGDLAVLVG
jgi:menaquinone-dependent protoporphyrinogen oxidase